MEETVKRVGALDRRIVFKKADVRDIDAVRQACQAGVAELGPVDIVLANAGIAQLGSAEPDPITTFREVVDINLVGVWNSVSPMVMNEVLGKYVAENPEAAKMTANLMPVDLIDPVDISNAILFLVSDDGRYVSGVTLPVDAGFLAR